MTTASSPLSSGLVVAVLALSLPCTNQAANAPIPFSEIGAKATAGYKGDALAITLTPDGARLRCGFQKLEGRATTQGLLLESTVPGGGRFRLTAAALGREDGAAKGRPVRPATSEPNGPAGLGGCMALAETGNVAVADVLADHLSVFRNGGLPLAISWQLKFTVCFFSCHRSGNH